MLSIPFESVSFIDKASQVVTKCQSLRLDDVLALHLDDVLGPTLSTLSKFSFHIQRTSSLGRTSQTIN
jgi:hypothetical protein